MALSQHIAGQHMAYSHPYRSPSNYAFYLSCACLHSRHHSICSIWFLSFLYLYIGTVLTSSSGPSSPTVNYAKDIRCLGILSLKAEEHGHSSPRLIPN